MAAPKEPKVEIKEETIDLTNSTTENDQLRKEIADLKLMFAQMMEAQNLSKQEVAAPISKANDANNVYYDIDEELNINPNKMVKIVSMVIGGLNLKANNNTLYFPKFGDSAKVPFEELRTIVRNHDDLARNGAFIITDQIAVRGLYLEDEYEHILGVKSIEQIIDLPTNEIVSVLKGATKIQRDTILQTIIRGIPSGDNRYTDYNKIKAISDYVGQDITELAKELI